MNANSSTVSERIYTAIRNDILNKTLVSGEKLTIKSILYEEAQNGRLTDAARKIRIQSTIFSNQYEVKEENRREIRSKGHHIEHGFGISPSADGNRTAVASGHFPVSGQQGAQHRAVRRPPGRLFSFSRPGVCVRKPILLDLRAGVRKLRRRTGRSLCSPLPANPYALVSGSKTPCSGSEPLQGFLYFFIPLLYPYILYACISTYSS